MSDIITARSAESRADSTRVHVQESLNSIDVFRVTEPRLRAQLDARPALRQRLDISYGASRADLDAGLATAEVLLVGNFESEDLQRRAPGLKWVQSIFAGVEKLLPAIPPSVILTNGSGIHAEKAGEFAIGAILQMNNAMPQLMAQQRRGEWRPIFSSALTYKTVIILGTGKLAARVADHCGHFGMVVIGVNRSGRAAMPFPETIPIAKLHDVLPRADYVVVTLPNTPATHHLLDAAAFALLAPGAGLVSIGRGQVIDEAAMAHALTTGQLGCAVLDVFEREPLPAESPLWALDNAIITPHCGVDDLTAYLPSALEIFLDNLERYRAGEALENIVDPQLGY